MVLVCVDDLIVYISINRYKLPNVAKCFSHNFRIRFRFIVYVYGFDLFIRVCLKADNRSNPIPGFFGVVFVFFKIALVVIWLTNSCESVNFVFVNFEIL